MLCGVWSGLAGCDAGNSHDVTNAQDLIRANSPTRNAKEKTSAALLEVSHSLQPQFN
jgi:hypothetical protein